MINAGIDEAIGDVPCKLPPSYNPTLLLQISSATYTPIFQNIESKVDPLILRIRNSEVLEE